MNSRTPAQSEPQSTMARSLIRLLLILAFGSFSAIAMRPLTMLARSGKASVGSFASTCILLLCVAVIATGTFHYLLRIVVPMIDASALAQARFLDTFNARYADIAIFFSAALSLFLELGIIRWQSSVLPFIALYKNFSLLACFLGLGLGYALAARDRIPLIIALPLLAWQFSFLTFVRYGLGNGVVIIPFHEQLSMGIGASNLPQTLFLYGLLAIVFLITALTFMPI